MLSRPSVSEDVFGLPTWVRIGLQFGAPTLAAGYLTWMIATGVSADVRAIKEAMAQHMAATDAFTQQRIQDSNDQDKKLEILIRIAQTQCVNTAADAAQRRDCVAAGAR